MGALDGLAGALGELLAGGKLRRDLHHHTVQLAEFHGHVAERQFHGDEFTAQFTALGERAAHAEGARLAQQQFGEAVCIRWRAQHGE